MTASPHGRGKRLAFAVVLALLPVVAVALLEGTASLALFARTLLAGPPLAEESHTEPDTLLGWINLPNVSRPDFYAPGVGLHTNGQRFRHRGALAAPAAEGGWRIVCSGDSFTLGYGVDDAETWCEQLRAGDPSLETVNMGQGGYGIDQAYLWFRRDGLALRPDLQIFGVIVPDLHRMASSSFAGYPKPQLVRDGDSVRAVGVPVPRPGLRRTMATLTGAARTLRTFELLERLGVHPFAPRPEADRATWDVARAAFRHLARRNSLAGGALLVVWLPRWVDRRPPHADPWRHWAREAAARHEFVLVDLVEPFRRLPADSAEAMFIQPGTLAFEGAAGHYTAAGNAWVARELRRVIPSPAARAPRGPAAVRTAATPPPRAR